MGVSRQALKCHTAWAFAVAFSLDGKILASGLSESIVRLWDVATGVPWRTLSHKGWIDTVAFSLGSKMVASASRSGTVRLWHAASDAALQRL
jgi:WD40 repeat protein